jgi:hypothetical protein
MASTNDHDVALTWSASSTQSMSNNTTRYVSDARSIDATAVAAVVRVLVDNAGTPAAGDVVDLWIAWSPDGTNFDTDEHAQSLGRLDTVAANDPGEDPAAKTYRINIQGHQSFKLISRAPQSATRNITISAIYNELRMS